MVSIFKSYRPAVIFLLLLYTLIFRVFYFFEQSSVQLPANNTYISEFIFKALNNLVKDKHWVSFFLAAALVFFQALYFNYLINLYRILNRSSYLPAMAYILLASLFKEFIFLSPALIANTLLLFALSKILKTYKKEKVLVLVFDAALLISLASLFYFPYIVFFIFLLTSLLVLRPFKLREYIISALGLLVPYYFLLVYFFWHNNMSRFIEMISIDELSFTINQITFSPYVAAIGSVLLLVVLWLLFHIQANIFKMVVQVRSNLMVFIFFFLSGVLSLLVDFNGGINRYLWIIPPFALAFAIFYMEMRRRWISEVVHLFLILTILFYQYSNLFH